MSLSLISRAAPWAVLAALLLVPALQASCPAETASLNVMMPPDADLQTGNHPTPQSGTMRMFGSPTPPGEQTRIDDQPRTDEKPGTEEKPKRKLDVPFVQSPIEVVREMLKMADVKKDDLLYDLGCGDGIIVVTASKEVGCKTVGYDIDPQRVKEAKDRAKEAQVEDLVTIEEKDIFTLDVSKASVIMLYLLPEMNEKLVPQMNKLKEGSRIACHNFPIPGYKADKKKKVLENNGRVHEVYLYTIPLKKEK